MHGCESLGYLLGFRHLTFYANGPVGWVEEMIVRHQDRGQGIGRVLMNAFGQLAAEQGCALVAHVFEEGRPVSPVLPATIAHSLAIGAPADGDLAIATARTSGGALYAVPEDDIGANMSLLAETSGVFGETAAGVTIGALRAAVASGAIGEDDRVVAIVTGSGLKTPQAVDTREGIHIDADVDLLLAGLGVSA